MSTFDGRVLEFPDIRIDNFRISTSTASANHRPVLAYFLSHVHTDHTVGLEACHGPFIYCSPATKALLLKLEKFPHRMNFARGVLETRRQTFRAQAKLFKAIPLYTPTELELRPGRSIRVTLLDANHCPGAVMFLIEGDGKAVLYTGDVRAEKWWVDGLIRQPVLAPYVCSTAGLPPLKRLDCIYLDTTFVTAGKEDPWCMFPSKAEGVRELLGKVAKYPADTLFYFDSWTFGYEEVWEALVAFLDVRVHVDDYRFGMYTGMALDKGVTVAPEASRLIGFLCGNHFQPGCITREQTRLHSCEYGMGCEIFKKDFVRISPIVTRHDGIEYIEAGVGGGQGDLDQRHELEVNDSSVVGELMGLCASQLEDNPHRLAEVMTLLSATISGKVQSLSLKGAFFAEEAATQGKEGAANGSTELSLAKLATALGELVSNQTAKGETEAAISSQSVNEDRRADGLPKRITFPYSRHASYSELCWLLEAFTPKDIFPCTVDSVGWTPERSMSFLFGHLYTDDTRFRHDQMMLQRIGQQQFRPGPIERKVLTENKLKRKLSSPLPAESERPSKSTTQPPTRPSSTGQADSRDPQPSRLLELIHKDREPSQQPPISDMPLTNPPKPPLTHSNPATPPSPILSETPTTKTPENIRYTLRKEVWDAVSGRGELQWAEIGLVSVGGHQEREEEL